jgi:murein DD-endopeptidase MepM/ murein hydrolase activator NlpD
VVPFVAGAVVTLLAVALAVSWPSRPQLRAGRAPGAARQGGAEDAAPHSERASEAAPDPDPRLVPFATWRRLELGLPSVRVRCVCYHEASYDDALALHPLGRLRRDYNPTKFPSDEPSTPGPGYVVMSSRGRATPATSAADLVMPRRTDIVAPVSGVVTKVKRYRLYGRYVDVKVQIRPDERPDVRVLMIHVDRVHVRERDAVTRGATVIGVPRPLPFGSQSDLYIPGRHPHVHVELVDPGRTR